MDKLTLLDELIIRIQSGEIKTVMATNKESELVLREVKMIVEKALYEDVVKDVTGYRTEYYAPEWDSWKQFLAECNGYADYQKILNEKFTECELAELWQESHIAEDMEEDEIKKELISQIGQLKIFASLCREKKPVNPEKAMQGIVKMQARIQGLYNMLYE